MLAERFLRREGQCNCTHLISKWILLVWVGGLGLCQGCAKRDYGQYSEDKFAHEANAPAKVDGACTRQRESLRDAGEIHKTRLLAQVKSVIRGS
jgi:hypothetical protein